MKPSIESAGVSEQVAAISKEILSKIIPDAAQLETYLKITNEIAAGKTFGQGYGLSDQEQDALLKLASGYYVAGNYHDAVRLYSLAAILNHLDARPFKGMAMSLQKLNHHDVALDCLGAALLKDPADLEMVEMAAESMAMNGQAEQADQIRQQLNANQNTQKNRNGYASYQDVTHT